MFLAAVIKTMILQELQLRPKILQTAENNVTYYAKWIPDCDVVFDFDGGASTNYVISIPNGVKIDEPIEQPNKAGYVFKYWALSTNLNQEYNWNTEIQIIL